MVSIFSRVAVIVLIMLLPGCNRGLKNPNQPVVSSHGIIPLPKQADILPGKLLVDSTAVFLPGDSFTSASRVVDDMLSVSLRSRSSVDSDTTGKVTIRFVADNSLEEEGYRIQVTGTGIKLFAGTPAGAFYAAQSLRQIVWAITEGERNKSFEIRYINISDSPEYSWRGFHIDVSRHFFSKEYILKVIDELSYYKINKLHLHLTDDQGWRVEISQFPLLTEKGAWRTFNEMDSTCIRKAATDQKYIIDNRFITSSGGQTLYGGFYSKQYLRDIVEYAADRFIEVIPEIDMPGHMSAAINAYPFLSCTGTTGWGEEFSYPICPCNTTVLDFCHRVWDEIAELFPSKYVHIGGDEVEKAPWGASSECQSFMALNNLHSLNEIQNYFVNDMQHYLESKGKTVVAWDDVIDGKADNHLLMMYWRDWVKDAPDRCAANGNSIILTPWSQFYISGDHTDKTLQDLYEYDPEAVLSSEAAEKVIGMQSCLWSEEIPSEAMFEYLVYPRMQALSEIAWGAGRDWPTFKIRLQYHLKYMASKNIGYRKPTWAD